MPQKEKTPLGCVFGIIGIIGIIVYFIIFIFNRDLPFWPLLITFGLLIFGAISLQNSNNKNEKNQFKAQGIDPTKFIYSGKYLSGHIKINKPIEDCYLYLKKDVIKIYCLNKSTLTKSFLANIETSKIENISFEDESSIQKRVGLKRMIAVGIFAFAIKKKEKKELAYIIIEWNHDKFKQETVFEFEGKNSIEKANTLRNNIINGI